MKVLTAAVLNHGFTFADQLRRRSLRWSRVLISAVVLGPSLAGAALAQYSSNLNDINTTEYGFWMKIAPASLKPSQQATSIGDLGKLEQIVDMRGFVPMSLLARSRQWTLSLVDHLAWFEVPTKKAVLLLYYGDLTIKDLAPDDSKLESLRFRGTRVVSESAAKGEAAEWCNIAYDLAKNAAPAFEKLAGAGYQSAEPTTILFTANSAFVFVNFKYESTLVAHGQVLVAMEFARSSKKYKTLYKLYSTEVMGKSAAEAAVAFAPIAAKVLVAYLGSDDGH